MRFWKSVIKTTALTAALAFVGWSIGCETGGETAAEGTAVTQLPEGGPNPGYCIVMGNKVDMEKAGADEALHSDYQGKRYYFCCEGCKPKFDQDPEKWIASPATPKVEEEKKG